MPPAPRRNRRSAQSDNLGRFLRWWGRELAGLVPRTLRTKTRPSSRMLWLSQESGAAVFWRSVRGKVQEIGRLDLTTRDVADQRIAFEALHAKAGRWPIGVCVPAEQVLRKELVLPLAAEANLAQVLGFELGRHTPFAADQAYYDGRVVREDRAGQRLHVQLTATVKSRVDELLGRLLEWGVTPHYIGVADELLGKGDCVNLLPVHLRPKRSNLDYWLYAGMAGVTLLLLATILLTPLWQKRELVIAIQPILAKAQQQADAVDALKREQDRLLAEYNFPLERKLTTPPRVAVLEEVTRILPDDTWLQQLDIQGGGVTMQGITSASSRLIGLLEKSATLENASFKSPLVKVQPGEERFQLAASLKAIPLADALAFQRALAEGKKAKGKSKAEAKPIDAKAKPNPLPGGKP